MTVRVSIQTEAAEPVTSDYEVCVRTDRNGVSEPAPVSDP